MRTAVVGGWINILIFFKKEKKNNAICWHQVLPSLHPSVCYTVKGRGEVHPRTDHEGPEVL